MSHSTPPLAGLARWLPFAGALCWTLTIGVALLPAPDPEAVGSSLDPRQVEGLVVATNLVRGLCVVWGVLAGWSQPSSR